MTALEFERVRDKARARQKTTNSRRRRLYRYARERGFSSIECQILCASTKARIDRLAKERDAGERKG